MSSAVFPIAHTVGTSPYGTAPTADPNAIITALYNEPGWLAVTSWQAARAGSPLLQTFERTKEEFPAGQGSTYNELILDVGGPNETDVLGWTTVKEASPGYNPGATTFTKTIEYGHRKVHACLTTDAIRTEAFNRQDLAFKPKLDEQLRQVSQIMANYTRLLWEYWLPMAFQNSVRCITLNAAYSNRAGDVGRYERAVLPTSVITHAHLEEQIVAINAATRGISSPEEAARLTIGNNRQLVFIGEQALVELEQQYIKRSAGSYGYLRQEVQIPEIGATAIRIGKYDFVTTPTPRRFRAPATVNESWDACIVPSTIMVTSPSGKGKVRVPNPDYYNPEVVIAEETMMVNLDAVKWLTPPRAMTAPSASIQQKKMFGPTNYSGEFVPIMPSKDNDPFGDYVYYAGRFMSGMLGRFPERARSILHLPVHTVAADVRLDVHGSTAPTVTTYAIRQCVKMINGRLQLLVVGELPAVCPDGTSLFAVTSNGLKYLIGTVHSTTAYAGDAINPAGNLYEISFPSGLSAIQTCRPDCDPWSHLACLGSQTPSDPATGEPCALCGDGTAATEDEDCTLLAQFFTDSVSDVVDSGDSSLVTGEPFTAAATLQTALNNYLSGAGGGTAVVTKADDYLWTVVITGAAGAGLTALLTGAITFSDGLGTNEVPFIAENCA